jgi:hypothetical protein
LTVRGQDETTRGCIVNGNVLSMLLVEEESDWLLVELTVNEKKNLSGRRSDAGSQGVPRIVFETLQISYANQTPTRIIVGKSSLPGRKDLLEGRESPC